MTLNPLSSVQYGQSTISIKSPSSYSLKASLLPISNLDMNLVRVEMQFDEFLGFGTGRGELPFVERVLCCLN